MDFATCDLCDAHEQLLIAGQLAALPPVFQQYGKSRRFAGRATTLRVFEDSEIVRATLEAPGNGNVLAIGGCSLHCALVGGNLAALAEKNGWTGLIVHGCIRDVDEINQTNIGVRALAAMPVKSIKRGSGERDISITIAGIAINPGDWIYADADGVLVAQQNLIEGN